MLHYFTQGIGLTLPTRHMLELFVLARAPRFVVNFNHPLLLLFLFLPFTPFHLTLLV